MAPQAPTEAAIDWARFEAEILKYYIDQNHSVEDTQAHMKENFGFNATSVLGCPKDKQQPRGQLTPIQCQSVQEAIRRLQEHKSRRMGRRQQSVLAAFSARQVL